jgi:recombinational DNA repair protein (RecF pathway)
LDLGEQICEVHEALQACFPEVDLEFEQVMLLAIGLSRHESIDLTTCVRCGIAVLADQLSVRRQACSACYRPAAPSIGTTVDAPGELSASPPHDQLVQTHQIAD